MDNVETQPMELTSPSSGKVLVPKFPSSYPFQKKTSSGPGGHQIGLEPPPVEVPQDGKDAEAPSPPANITPPSVRMRKFLQSVKAKRMAERVAASTVPASSEPAHTFALANTPAEVKHQDTAVEALTVVEVKTTATKVLATETKTEPTGAVAKLPAKPADWEKHGVVTADQQLPPKPRGRKPKETKEAKEVKEPKKPAPKSKARARSAAKETKETKVTCVPKAKPRARKRNAEAEQQKPYEPFEHPGEIGMDKPKAFDAYALACAAADVNLLESSASGSSSKEKKRKKDIQTEPSKEAPKRGTATKRQHKEVQKDKEEEQEAGATCSKSTRTAEQKAKLSRKSCAYKKVLNQKLREGIAEEDAKAAARQVSYRESNKSFCFLVGRTLENSHAYIYL